MNEADRHDCTPLYYSIILGNSETLSLLMKADCSLNINCGSWENLLEWSIRLVTRDDFKMLGISQEARMDVLATLVASLAERRRNLQSRLAALPTAYTINTGVIRDDRILDEYAEYAEGAEKDALEVYDHMPRYASSLLPGCRTVYHCRYFNAETAEKLWQNGFRDIDVPDENGLTPLMCYQLFETFEHLVNEITLCSWLIEKGAKLHRPQHGILDYDPGCPPNLIKLPPTTRALHYVAAKIGESVVLLRYLEYGGLTRDLVQDTFSQLKKDARLLPKTIFLDVSSDDCTCACSSQGCLACTMILKSFGEPSYLDTRRIRLTVGIEYLSRLVGPHDLYPDWLVKEIIRYCTFKELELRHTCCQWDSFHGLTKLESEEQAEIRDEDHEKIELLENLLQEFEENRGAQDVLSFLEGYWATRMDHVLQEQGCVDEDALRELGVVLRPDQGRD